MIIVETIGGLGNQMFQYAFKIAYETKNKVPVKLNRNTFNTYRTRTFQLDQLNVDGKYASQDEVDTCMDCRAHRYPLKHSLWRLVRGKPQTYITSNVFEEKTNLFDPSALMARENCYFRGYFQSERYFSNCRDILRAHFRPKVTTSACCEMRRMIDSCNSVSVHVRRGDYIDLKDIYGCCDKDYYKRAIDKVREFVDKPTFFVFSNDLHWTLNNLDFGDSFVAVDINDEEHGCLDIDLMRHCQHNIIANSTFSWWGAWLNDHEDRQVIAPRRWFANDWETEIVPETWTRV